MRSHWRWRHGATPPSAAATAAGYWSPAFPSPPIRRGPRSRRPSRRLPDAARRSLQRSGRPWKLPVILNDVYHIKWGKEPPIGKLWGFAEWDEESDTVIARSEATKQSRLR